jgi:hypothetical protein
MRETHQSAPPDVEIKNEWHYTSTSPYALFEETLVDTSNQLPHGTGAHPEFFFGGGGLTLRVYIIYILF